MGVDHLVERLRNHPESSRIGMIACHLGLVRENSLKGFKVREIKVVYGQNELENIVNEIKSMDCIVDVLVEIREGVLKVGDEILAVAVAGETREMVFPALMRTVDRIKAEAVKKHEIPLL